MSRVFFRYDGWSGIHWVSGAVLLGCPPGLSSWAVLLGECRRGGWVETGSTGYKKRGAAFWATPLGDGE